VAPPHSFRGFRPNDELIPPEFNSPEKWRDFFHTNAVPGIRYIDIRASEWVKRKDRCYAKSWHITDEQAWRFDIRCWIPAGEEVLEEGLYSWNTAHPGWDNCASWAIKVVNQVMEDDFLPIPVPARISKVAEKIKWDEYPDNKPSGGAE
jgi:hypothetical protein